MIAAIFVELRRGYLSYDYWFCIRSKIFVNTINAADWLLIVGASAVLTVAVLVVHKFVFMPQMINNAGKFEMKFL